jgi:hypothetical protein
MPAADVKREGVEQTLSQAFASKFLSADRASGIFPLENSDAQSGLIFRHSVRLSDEIFIVYVNVYLTIWQERKNTLGQPVPKL